MLETLEQLIKSFDVYNPDVKILEKSREIIADLKQYNLDPEGILKISKHLETLSLRIQSRGKHLEKKAAFLRQMLTPDGLYYNPKPQALIREEI